MAKDKRLTAGRRIDHGHTTLCLCLGSGVAWVWPYLAATTPLPLVLACVLSASAKLLLAARPCGTWPSSYTVSPPVSTLRSSLVVWASPCWLVLEGNEKPMAGPLGEPGGPAVGTAGRLVDEGDGAGPEPPSWPRDGRRPRFIWCEEANH